MPSSYFHPHNFGFVASEKEGKLDLWTTFLVVGWQRSIKQNVLVDLQFKVNAACLVVLVVLDIARPQLTPDLNEAPRLRALELHEDDWLSVVERVHVGVEGLREAKRRIKRHGSDVVYVSVILRQDNVYKY